MCGLVYANSLDGSPVNTLVWDQFDKQRKRGVEGFGFFNGKYTIKAAIEKRIKSKINSKKNQTDLLLFHHRFPTSTENVKKAAHPFNTGSYFGKTRYVLIHNGVISNAKETYEKHTKLKKPIAYQSKLENGKFNDSEALLWDLALTLEGKQKEMTVYGGIAFIAIKLVDNVPQKLYFGKNAGRPLKMKRDEHLMMLSSEGEGEDIKEATLYTYNYKTRRLTNRFFRIPSYNPAYASNWDYNKKYGTSSGYRYAGGTTSTPHSHNISNAISDNVCAPGSGVLSNPHTSEINWWDLCEHDDIIFDSSGAAHYPSDCTFYQDGTYELWNDFKEDWETAYWLDEEFVTKAEDYKQGTTGKAMDFIITPPKKQKAKADGSSLTMQGSLASAMLKPKQQDVALLVFEEIGKANGYFDAAYFSMEKQWADLEIKYEGILPPITDRKRIALLLEGMKQIENMPEYVDEKSIHSMWVFTPKEMNPHVDEVEDKQQTNFLHLVTAAEGK